jgi:NAD-dependent deacetylase
LLDRVIGILRRSRSVLFITGAGISADSGLPTYRGIGGLYNGSDSEEGLSIEELLSGSMLRRRPELTWKYLGQVERAARQATFNRGHQVIAEMEAHFPRVWTLTQNIDDFHRRAGSRNLLEIHGNLHRLYCMNCGARQTVADYSGLAIPPRCPACSGMLRPDVVLFGEMLPTATLERLYEECSAGFDVVFTVGTTSVFPYIAEPVRRAARLGRPTIEVNPAQTAVSDVVDVKFSAGAADTLDAIWRQYQG